MINKVVVRSARSRTSEESPLARGLSRLLRERAMRRPAFSGCWIAGTPAGRSSCLESYEVGTAKVSVHSLEDGGLVYDLLPWEYSLPSPWVSALSKVMDRVAMIPPADIGAPLDEMRGHVINTSSRLLQGMAASGSVDLGKGIEEREQNIARLAEVTARYTVGLGVFELLLRDDRIEDIYVDAPSWSNPVHLTMNVKGIAGVCRCSTNITASGEEVENLVARLKQYSGKPFSEAFPIMETDVPTHDSRATVIGPPLSPDGTAIALRRHSRTPWTLLKLAFNGSLDAATAGLLSFLIDGRSTMLICGARGAGKSSLLSALLFEFPLSQRILTIEDTLELPVRQMQAIGYKVQSLFVEQRMEQSTEEMADQALRVSLRLGESAIVLGEVRGKEAQTLYQSMRTGRAGSSVLGTIHGDSAVSVYERVVHDMGIPKEAFAATDIVMTMSLSRPGGSSRPIRRLVEVAESGKAERVGVFNNLLAEGEEKGTYSLSIDSGSECVSRVARSWGMNYQDALDNINARAQMRQVLLNAVKVGGGEFLEPVWVYRCNEFLARSVDRGDYDYDGIVAKFRSFVQGRCGRELE